MNTRGRLRGILPLLSLISVAMMIPSLGSGRNPDDASVVRLSNEQNVILLLRELENAINYADECSIEGLRGIVSPSEFGGLKGQLSRKEIAGQDGKITIRPVRDSSWHRLRVNSSSEPTDICLPVRIFVEAGNAVSVDTSSIIVNFSKKKPVVANATGLMTVVRSANKKIQSTPAASDLFKGSSSQSVSTADIAVSNNMFIPKPVYGANQRFSIQRSRAEFDGEVIFNRPYDAYSLRYENPIDWMEREYLVVTDANWDRVIASIKYPSEPSDNAILALGGHGQLSGQYSNPGGISCLNWLWYITDVYNHRVQVLYGLDNVPQYITSISAFLSKPVDVDAAQIPDRWDFYNTMLDMKYVAVVDQGSSDVKLYSPEGTYVRSIGNSAYGSLQLNRPTSVCFAKDMFDHFAMKYIYVTDNGNRRLALFGLEGSYLGKVVEGIFPTDAYLSSIDVDAFGYVYVLDSYHGIIYLFAPFLQYPIAKFGSTGTADGQLYYPNRISFSQGYEFIDRPGRQMYPLVLGDMLATEHFGEETGIRRYDIGLDILSNEMSYVPKGQYTGVDYLTCKYMVTGPCSSWCDIYFTLFDEEPRYSDTMPIVLAGENTFWINLGTDTLPNDGYFKCSIRCKSLYTGRETISVESLFVHRHVDTLLPRIDIYSYGVGTYADTLSAPECLAPSTDYWRAWVRVRDRLDSIDVFKYRWRQGINSGFVVDVLFKDGLNYGVNALTTFNNSVAVRFLSAPYYPNSADTELVFENGDLLNLITVEIYDQDGNRLPCPVNDPPLLVECTPAQPIYNSYYDHLCHTPCTTCVPPPPHTPGGCPMLYVFDGSGYMFVNNLLPESEGETGILPNLTDFSVMPEPRTEFPGEYNFLIREDETEISDFDNIELWTIDLAYDFSDLRLTDRSSLVNGTQEKTPPFSAITNAGTNVTSLLASEDGLVFNSFEPGYIDLEYRLRVLASPDKPMIEEPPGGIDPGDPAKGIEKISASSVWPSSANVFSISVRKPTGQNELVARLFPRMRKSLRMKDLSNYLVNNTLKIRLSWTNSISIDFLPYVRFEKLSPAINRYQIAYASHSDAGNVTSLLTGRDLNKATLRPGEEIALTVLTPPPDDSLKRFLLLKTIGRYQYSSGGSSRFSEQALPEDFSFEQNYPNPFNPVTNFRFALPTPTRVTLEIFNILGQRVKSIVDKPYPAGVHEIGWDGTNNSGEPLSTGVYFARLGAEKFSATRKVVIVK